MVSADLPWFRDGSFMKSAIAVFFVAATILLAGARQGSAALILFEGSDAGAGPSDVRPDSDLAASGFDMAAGLLGPVSLIDLESAPLGDFASLEISPGVNLTLSGTAPEGGIRTAATYFSGSRQVGYNTTFEGEQFLGVVPIFAIQTATLGFQFDDPIQAFGMYVTGLGTANGDLFAVFDDGTSQEISITGALSGGVQFFGFTDAGKSIVEVSFELRNVSFSRDVFAVDDIQFVQAAPEPSTLLLLGTGLLAAAAYRRRKN